MYYKYYLMTDFNDKYRSNDWLIMTECPKEKIEEFASFCWGDVDYLVRLIKYDGYECRVIDFDMIEWR